MRGTPACPRRGGSCSACWNATSRSSRGSMATPSGSARRSRCFARAKEYLFTGDLMTAAEAERIGLINHVVPADQLDEKVYGLARRLAGGAMRSIRWTKQTVNIPLRQLAHSMMDLSLSLETQSNLSKFRPA